MWLPEDSWRAETGLFLLDHSGKKRRGKRDAIQEKKKAALRETAVNATTFNRSALQKVTDEEDNEDLDAVCVFTHCMCSVVVAHSRDEAVAHSSP